MCLGPGATLAMVAAGRVATTVAVRRSEPRLMAYALGELTLIEVLQVAGQAVVDDCGKRANGIITRLSYLHIAFYTPVIIALSPALRRGLAGERWFAWSRSWQTRRGAPKSPVRRAHEEMGMHDEEESPRIKAATDRLGRPLDGISVAELQGYIRALEAEIVRVRDEIDKRGDHRAAAEALFKRPSGASGS